MSTSCEREENLQRKHVASICNESFPNGTVTVNIPHLITQPPELTVLVLFFFFTDRHKNILCNIDTEQDMIVVESENVFEEKC